MVRFNRIVFAGSVVRTDFDWERFPGQVGSVLNLVATDDLVVAGLPGAFERLGLGILPVGVGGAGYFGFSPARSGRRLRARWPCRGRERQALTDPAGKTPQVTNFTYLKGGHGIGVSESLWRDIAAYVVDEIPIPRRGDADTAGRQAPARAPTDDLRPQRRSALQKAKGLVFTFLPVAILAFVIGLFVALVACLDGWWLAGTSAALVLLIRHILWSY